jgi:hypothetical protein
VTSPHSAAVVLAELGRDLVQTKHLLCELDVVLEIAGAAELVQDINELLLLAQKLLLELLACLLTCLLRRDLGSLLTLLTSLFGSLALARDGLALGLARHGRRRWLGGGPVILVHTLHVIKEIVATREAMALYGTLAVTEVAEMRSGTVAVHTMCLAFVTEEASSRRELNADTGLLVAAEWLQVRVDVFAAIMIR